MYRAKYESKITVKVVNQSKKFSVEEITVNANLSGENLQEKARAAYKPENDIIPLWKTATVKEINMYPFEMDESKFLELAEKMDKPNPSYISKSYNTTLATVTVVHEDESFSEESLSVSEKLTEENAFNKLANLVKDGELFSVEKITVASGLYGMRQEVYFKNATKGEAVKIYPVK